MLINKDNYHDAIKQLFSGRTKLQLIKDDPFTRLKAVPNYLNNLWKPTRQQELERRRNGVCAAQWRRRYIPNKTPNGVLMEHRQEVSVVRLHDVSREGKSNIPSVRFQDVSNKSQMKHTTTSQWCVTKTSQWNISPSGRFLRLIWVTDQMSTRRETSRVVSIIN